MNITWDLVYHKSLIRFLVWKKNKTFLKRKLHIAFFFFFFFFLVKYFESLCLVEAGYCFRIQVNQYWLVISTTFWHIVQFLDIFFILSFFLSFFFLFFFFFWNTKPNEKTLLKFASSHDIFLSFCLFVHVFVILTLISLSLSLSLLRYLLNLILRYQHQPDHFVSLLNRLLLFWTKLIMFLFQITLNIFFHKHIAIFVFCLQTIKLNK